MVEFVERPIKVGSANSPSLASCKFANLPLPFSPSPIPQHLIGKKDLLV